MADDKLNKRYKEFRLYNFSAGLNNKDASPNLRPEESPDLQNVVLSVDEKGPVMKRPGTEYYRGVPVVSGKSTTSIWEFVKRAGTTYFLAAAGTHVKKAITGDWESLLGTFTDGAYFEAITEPMIDKSLFVNGEDGYFEFDGTTCQEVPAYEPDEQEQTEIGLNSIPADAKYIAPHKYRVWMANTGDYPDRAYFCGADINGNILYNYFPTTNWLRVSTPRGEAITGLAVYLNDVFIFTKSTMWKVTGDTPSEYVLSQVSASVGCVAHRSVVENEGLLYFLAVDGWYKYNGTKLSKVSQRISKTIKSIGQEYRNRVCAATQGRNLVISVPESTENDLTLQFDTEVVTADYVGTDFMLATNPWVLHRGFTVTDWLAAIDGNLYFSSPTGYVCRFGSGLNDNGEAIDSYFATKDFNFDRPEMAKRFRKLYLRFHSNKGFLKVYYKIAEGDWVELKEINMDRPGGVVVEKLNINRIGTSIAFKFANKSADENWKVYGFTLDFIAKGTRL